MSRDSRLNPSGHFHKSRTLENKFILGDEIGKGAYGRVYKGLDLQNGAYVAIKQVSLENIGQEDLNIIMVYLFLLYPFCIFDDLCVLRIVSCLGCQLTFPNVV
ncbi:MAP3K epsilon protein kinase 2-like protein [Drosera capensis]